MEAKEHSVLKKIVANASVRLRNILKYFYELNSKKWLVICIRTI